MSEDDKIKNFEKKQLNKLISDLRDINTYTSFKNGSFIYDLGKYQGTLLVNYIDELEQILSKAIYYIKDHKDYNFTLCQEILCENQIIELLDILQRGYQE